MVIMILEKVPASLRGELSHWLLEVKTGIYIGHVNAMVRDKIWTKCDEAKGTGAIFQGWSTNTEQHFKMRIKGFADRKIVDWEGLQLIQESAETLKDLHKNRLSD